MGNRRPRDLTRHWVTLLIRISMLISLRKVPKMCMHIVHAYAHAHMRVHVHACACTFFGTFRRLISMLFGLRKEAGRRQDGEGGRRW